MIQPPKVHDPPTAGWEVAKQFGNHPLKILGTARVDLILVSAETLELVATVKLDAFATVGEQPAFQSGGNSRLVGQDRANLAGGVAATGAAVSSASCGRARR